MNDWPRLLANVQKNAAELLKLAVASIASEEFERRLRYCANRGDFDVRVAIDWESGAFEIEWGGGILAHGTVEQLWADELDASTVLTIPDTVDELLGGQA